jgi:DNA helicase IV
MPRLSKEGEKAYLEYVQENIDAREIELQEMINIARDAAVDNKAGQGLRDLFRESIIPDSDAPYFIRVDLKNGEIRYYGGVRLGQSTAKPIPESHKDVVDGLLILSSLSDGKGYTAEYAENLPELVARTRYDIRNGKLHKYYEENIGVGSQSGGVLAEDMVADNLQQTREKKMKPISSTLQPDQFRITREPITHSLAIQGPPGSGKTAVLLERLARIAYADQNVAKKGMLLIGPNKPFMEYVSQVLPALGETGISLKSIDELSEFSKQVNSEPVEGDYVLLLKGSQAMREALTNLVQKQVKILSKTALLRILEITIEFSPLDSYNLISEILEDTGVRTFSQQRRVAEVRLRTILVNRFQESWKLIRGDIRTIPGDPATLINQESAFKTIIRNMFPNVDPVGLLGKMKSDAAFFLDVTDGFCPLDECIAWIEEAESQAKLITPSDIPILDYLDGLLNDPVKKWGHIAVDEAQDLTPLELIMISRRLDENATVSLAGDLAQATGVQYYDDWPSILEEFDQKADYSLQELHTSYRVPSDVIQFAHQFLKMSDVDVEPSQTFLQRDDSLIFKAIADNRMRVGEVINSVTKHLGSGESVLVIAGIGDRESIEEKDFESIGKAHVSILDPREVKGLEFDHVILLNPDNLVQELDWPLSRLARLFYVLTTRSTKSLTLVGSNFDRLKEPLLGIQDGDIEDSVTEDVDMMETPPKIRDDVDEDFEDDQNIDLIIRESEKILGNSYLDDAITELDEALALLTSTDRPQRSILELCAKLEVNIQQASGEFLTGHWLFAGLGQIRCFECREKPQLIFIKHVLGHDGKDLADHIFAIACQSCALIREYSETKFGPIENVITGLSVEKLLKTKCIDCGGTP